MSRRTTRLTLLRWMLCCLPIAGCKSDPSTACPASCPAGQVCSEATGFVCQAPTSGCPAAGCGAGATCRADDVCTCSAGRVDCDQDLDQPGSNGCECAGGCEGQACAANNKGCSPTTAHACGSYTLHCDERKVCLACAAGSFNCDGLQGCESPRPCGAEACDPSAAFACPASDRFCEAQSGRCAACPAGSFNCDGVQRCEQDRPCADAGPAPATCDPTCTDYAPTNCVRNPAAGNRCEECLTDADCTGNPRSHGPRCDTSDLAGTGLNWCVCKDDSDCATSTLGRRCRETPTINPTPAFSQCTCVTDADCATPYTICEAGGGGYGRCRKPCREAGPSTPRDQTCAWFGKNGFCDEADGRCQYGQF